MDLFKVFVEDGQVKIQMFDEQTAGDPFATLFGATGEVVPMVPVDFELMTKGLPVKVRHVMRQRMKLHQEEIAEQMRPVSAAVGRLESMRQDAVRFTDVIA